MKNMIKTLAIIACIAATVTAQTALAETVEAKTADGIKAVLVVTPSKNMVDLMLTDVKTGKAVTDAKVLALIEAPDGVVQEKELLGMKMGKDFSFMNTLDISKKGRYSFAVTVEAVKKKVKFNFVYEVKQ